MENRNKELELEIHSRELYYKEEIKQLRIIAEDFSEKLDKNKDNRESKDVSELSRSSPNPEDQEIKLEKLTQSISKSIKDKIDVQNKSISKLNIEIYNLKFDKERLNSELTNLTEQNCSLQGALANQKFLGSEKNAKFKAETEEATCQTIIKGEEYDYIKGKSKNLLNNNEELQDTIEKLSRNKEELELRIKNRDKELNKANEYIEILTKKNNQNSQNNSNIIKNENILHEIANNSEVALPD